MGEERLEFPEVTDVDIAFGGYPEDWFKDVLMNRESPQEFQEKVELLFFQGGKLQLSKELPEEYVNKGFRIFKAIIGSFKPKHEHKIQVCGAILKAIT